MSDSKMVVLTQESRIFLSDLFRLRFFAALDLQRLRNSGHGQLVIKMIAYKWIACTIGLLALIASEVGMSQTHESLCTIKLFDREDYKGHIRLQWSSNTSTTFELKGTDKWLSETLKLPGDAQEVQIEGTLSWKHYQSGPQKSSGSSKCRFVDFAPAMRPLRSEESWGKRMDKFVKELIKLENQQQDRAESPSEQIEANDRVPAGRIKAAEERLKFVLPKEHKELLQDYGAWDFSDSFCVAIDDIDRADKQMRSIWGSPASEFASLSQENKTLYQSSVMLFVEAGDGYGALIYHPTSAGGEYYWIHQDELDAPGRSGTNKANCEIIPAPCDG